MKNLLSRLRCRTFAMTAIFLVSILSAFAQPSTIAIVNAGSSGSKLWVYAIDEGTKTVNTVYTQKLGCSLSDMIIDAAGAGGSSSSSSSSSSSDAGSANSEITKFCGEIKDAYGKIEGAYNAAITAALAKVAAAALAERATTGTALAKAAAEKAAAAATANALAEAAKAFAPASPTSPTKVKLYILATAGMRTKGPDMVGALYNHIGKKLVQSGRYSSVTAMTISGRYEGLYAWIAANYDKSLNFARIEAPGDALISTSTKGILEIGGASMQITFAAPAGQGAAGAAASAGQGDVFWHTTYGNIYSKSYIDGGVNTAYTKHAKDAKDAKNYTKFYEDCITARLQDIPRINPNLGFFGLGNTINGINNQANTKGKNFVNYLASYNAADAKAADAKVADAAKHFGFNTLYLKWVLTPLRLIESGVTPVDVDWTKGAAYDIAINKATTIEEHFYQPTPFTTTFFSPPSHSSDSLFPSN